MSKMKSDFRRMLLRLPPNRQDYTAIGIIAELASSLGIGLIGTYVEDSRVRGLADLPNAREFRGGSWQPFSTAQFAQDMATAAREAERLFMENAGPHKPALSFSVTRALADDLREAYPDDIVVVIEPNSAVERVTHQFNELLEAAFRSTSSILLVPGHAKRLLGPIIVLASAPSDPGITAALAMAASTGERLTLVSLEAPVDALSPVLERAKRAGIAFALAEAAVQDGRILLPAHVRGRLLIMSRGRSTQQPRLPGTPILLISPDAVRGDEPDRGQAA